MRLQLKIIELLTKKKNLTINQIAKELKESYSFVNRTIQNMIKDNLILSERIGHSLVCRLNISSDKTRALISLNEVNKKQEFLEKNKELKFVVDELIKIKAESMIIFGSYAKGMQTKESDIDLLIITRKNIDIANLARKIHSKYDKDISPIVMSKEQLIKQKDKPIIKEIIKYHIILEGFESFTNLMFQDEI